MATMCVSAGERIDRRQLEFPALKSTINDDKSDPMSAKMTMIYWKGEKFWLGKLLEHPEIMTQGRTLEELEGNLKDAYMMMVMDDVPHDANGYPRFSNRPQGGVESANLRCDLAEVLCRPISTHSRIWVENDNTFRSFQN